MTGVDRKIEQEGTKCLWSMSYGEFNMPLACLLARPAGVSEASLLKVGLRVAYIQHTFVYNALNASTHIGMWRSVRRFSVCRRSILLKVKGINGDNILSTCLLVNHTQFLGQDTPKTETMDALDIMSAAELLYGAGIDDSISSRAEFYQWCLNKFGDNNLDKIFFSDEEKVSSQWL
ncbi:hypothetical protein NQ318_021546 [Aromia moschata]|uniref:Uncharacterized protein n=1 Tax=Aromia moschata TaxID=1265417 RepID=A0AAV8ZCQ8_9CUCU|nr:hypothetical protein NQ318_021546 [Aromia moschata]